MPTGERITNCRPLASNMPVTSYGRGCWRAWFVALLILMIAPLDAVRADEDPRAARYADQIQPILIDHCFRCHADGAKKGNVAFDQFGSEATLLANREFWWSVLKNVRAGVMPPAGKPAPSAEQVRILADWIKSDVFQNNPSDPDPGRVTIRRLNRVEYQNTIRDLLGFEFKAEEEFPPDDTGYGFDTIGDVLTVSPLLLEKYLQAAETIVTAAVPVTPKRMPERKYRGTEFRDREREGGGTADGIALNMKGTFTRTMHADQPGEYQLSLDIVLMGEAETESARGTFAFKIDDRELSRETLGFKPFQTHHREFTVDLPVGDHRLTFDLLPASQEGTGEASKPKAAPDAKTLSKDQAKAPKVADSESKSGVKKDKAVSKPVDAKAEKPKTSELRVVTLRIQGPVDSKFWERTPNYERFFTRAEPPPRDAVEDRRVYARELLSKFAVRAFRRPVADSTIVRLVAIAEGVNRQPGKRFEEGIARAMVAVLASPRFVFRVEEVLPTASRTSHPLVDEFALASRLSYFLWSTMPDDELIRLASRGELRKGLDSQVKRMRADARSEALTRNFVGQWLEVRDVEGFYINERAVLRREGIRAKDIQNTIMGRELGRAMRRETDMLFSFVLKEDRDVMELVDCDYTFLNSRLAKHYGIPDVSGNEMRRVSLPKGSPRGGVLAHGSTLVVTSNPSRTSPVKRGKFILDNILGTPPPPPPPDIPALEEAKKDFKDREPTTREMMALHRSKAICSSCHSRMDPLGLALENFSALGMWRDKELDQPVDASGQLITGEPFREIRDLKKVLREKHRTDFYRCLTEKLLTYALGRGLDSSDVESVDRIVDRLEREGGHASALLMGVIESAPFQKRRAVSAAATESNGSSEPRARVSSKR
jgi:mono/diheme cytochrome c family protein